MSVSHSSVVGLLDIPKDVLQVILRLSCSCSLVLPDLSAAYDYYIQPEWVLKKEPSPYEKMVSKGGGMADGQYYTILAPNHNADRSTWIKVSDQQLTESKRGKATPSHTLREFWRRAIALRGVCRLLRHLAISDPEDRGLLCIQRLLPPITTSDGPKTFQALTRYLNVFGTKQEGKTAVPSVRELDLSFCAISQPLVDLLAASCPQTRILRASHAYPPSSPLPAVNIQPLVNLPRLEEIDVSESLYRRNQNQRLVIQSLPPTLRVIRSAGAHVLRPGVGKHWPDWKALEAAEPWELLDVPLTALETLEVPLFQAVNGWHSELEGNPTRLLWFLRLCPNLTYLDVSGWSHRGFVDWGKWIRGRAEYAQLVENLPGVFVSTIIARCPRLQSLRMRRSGLSKEDVDRLLKGLPDLVLLETDHGIVDKSSACIRSQYTISAEHLASRYRRWREAFASRPDIVYSDNDSDTFETRPVPDTIPQYVKDVCTRIPQKPLAWEVRDASHYGIGDGEAPRGSSSLGGEFGESDPGSFILDLQQPEYYASLVKLENGTYHVMWETSSSTPRPLHPYMTFEEYLVEGMRKGFARCWGTSHEAEEACAFLRWTHDWWQRRYVTSKSK